MVNVTHSTRKAAKVCVHCGNELDTQSKWRCKACLRKQNEYDSKHRTRPQRRKRQLRSKAKTWR